MDNIFDPCAYGRLARAARIIAGHDSVEEAVRAIQNASGLEISARTLYALERGEQTPTIPQYIVLAMTYAPPGGPSYWFAAFSEHVRHQFFGAPFNGTH